MSRRDEDVRRLTLRPRRGSINKRSIAKGRRARRGRRKDFTTVLLELGMIDARELAALEGLQLIKGDTPLQSTQTPTVVPSRLEGLREAVERFAAFVSNGTEAAVEFRVPQIADALELPQDTLTFIVKVSEALQIVACSKGDAFVWKGTEALCQRLETPPLKTHKRQGEAFEDLDEICNDALSHLCSAKEPLSVRQLLAEMNRNCTDDSLHHRLNCLLSILTGVGVLSCLERNAESFYALPGVAKKQSGTTVETPSSVESTATQMGRMEPVGTVPLFSVPIVMDNNLAALKAILEASTPPIDCTEHVSDYTPSRAVTQAAVMEIVGNEIGQVGVVDVLGQGSLTTYVGQQSTGCSPVIALAVPQWVLAQGGSPVPANSSQVFPLETVLPNAEPIPVGHLSSIQLPCIAVPPESVLALLSQSLTGTDRH